MHDKAVCDIATLCLPLVGQATVSPSTVATVIMGLPAFVWFAWQIVDKWRGKRSGK